MRKFWFKLIAFCKNTKKLLKKEIQMNKKLKKYRISPDESMCLAMSVVDSPAVESEFIALSADKEIETFAAVEKGERRMLYGCALRADFPIYRRKSDEEFYIEFSAEAIDKISKRFMKDGFQRQWTEGHKAEIEGLTITESWIKESMTMDKSIALGLSADIPVGSWFIGAYCENDDIWNAVKEGKYHGFSAEAVVSFEDFETQKPTEDIEPVEPEALEAQEPVAEPAQEPTEPEPVVEEPTVAQPTVEPVEQPVVEEPTVEEPVEQPKQDNHLEELIQTLRDEINALKESNGSLQDKIKELGKQPSVQPINTNAKNGSGGDNYSSWREQMRSLLR